jgi:hypothetical protein
MKHSHTRTVSCHEYTAMSAVATPICRTETSSMMPPHCTNSEMVSTSDVTRETSDPRRSES